VLKRYAGDMINRFHIHPIIPCILIYIGSLFISQEIFEHIRVGIFDRHAKLTPDWWENFTLTISLFIALLPTTAFIIYTIRKEGKNAFKG